MDWNKLTVGQLKAKLKEHGLDLSGKKADLVGRLLAHDEGTHTLPPFEQIRKRYIMYFRTYPLKKLMREQRGRLIEKCDQGDHCHGMFGINGLISDIKVSKREVKKTSIPPAS